ncbi:MAG: electron transport complex subunit RsxC [Cyclobacteriaceae bacterium]|nr:electron transport complex subunit RsxC [Cyclobacteriaceae bacterium]
MSLTINQTKTFPMGGVHPDENKFTADKPIQRLETPGEVAIPISQHIGAPAKPIVEQREKVKIGQVIASSGGFVSANIHASISGIVAKIDKVMDSTGYKRDAIIIKAGKDEQEWAEGIDLSPELVTTISLDQEGIIKKIAEAGIVGLGGATFPSHVKLSVPKGKSAEFLILNGVECEPYLTADHRLMVEKSAEIVVGAKILMKALGVTKTIIGIENNKPDAIQKMAELVATEVGMSVQPLKVQYPQGGEKQLIRAAIQREVPSGGLPIDVGAVVHNVGTAFAVYEAVQKNKPLIERVVTVTGKDIKNPSNFLVRIGTPVGELIEAAGGIPENTGKVISGGPMMGKALNAVDIPIAKGTSGILLIPNEESRRGKMKACIRCSQCVTVCPMGLEPYLLMTLTQKEYFERLESDKVMDCIECGSCSFTCPSDRPLLDYIRLGKKTVASLIRERNN